MANCKFCGGEIFWMKEGRKNIPHNMGGDEHDCDEKKQAFKNVSVDLKQISAEEIARYEQAINEKNKK